MNDESEAIDPTRARLPVGGRGDDRASSVSHGGTLREVASSLAIGARSVIMRTASNLCVAIAVLTVTGQPATAQTRKQAPSPQEAAATKMTDALVIRDADVPVLTVSQWERDGALFHAWPGDGKEIPYDASTVQAKLYNFPTGQLRKLTYPKGTRTHWHENESDILIYALAGKQVELVEEEVFYSQPGDASFHPGGVRHHSESVTVAVRAEFAFATKPGGPRVGVFHPNAEAPLRSVADLVQQENHVLVFGEAAETAPARSRFKLRRYIYPGYRLDEAHYPRGHVLSEHQNRDETLVYVVSGRLKITLAGAQHVVGAGDMFRMTPDSRFARETLEDSVTLEVNGSSAPPRR